MITYRITIADLHAHQFDVTVTVPAPDAQQRVSLPVWIPGSYLVREFARHLSGLQASQAGKPVRLTQLDKASWLAQCNGRGALTLRYRVYAFDTSVRAAFLDTGRGFFNGTGLCLRVDGAEAQPQRLVLSGLPSTWQVATALTPVKVDTRGQGSYQAADYDELVDHPVEMGPFWRGSFQVFGIAHEFVVAGAWPDFDGERLLADTRRICETALSFWHGAAAGKLRSRAPIQRYVFLLNAVEEGHGGLEHRASTALIAPRRDLPQRGVAEASEGYVNLLGLISHEYFHTWNVKRLRPAEFAHFDYGRENYTELLWFFEGFTSYYDDLLLRRAGLIDADTYLRLLSKTVTGVLAMPGRQVQSVAQASFDAWVKYYRPDENTPNATISYYTKGALVGLLLDLTLRRAGRASLDDVMRQLWASSDGGPIGEAQILAALRAVAGRSLATELAAWVHGTQELPLQAALDKAGVAWQHQPATLAQSLSLRVSESALTGIRVSHVMTGGAAEQAGLAAGDEVLAVDGWRLRRLDDATRLLVPGRAVACLISRDQRVIRLQLSLPPQQPVGSVSLSRQPKPVASAAALRKAWLDG